MILAELRRKKSFTQQKLANQVGVTRQTISAIECDKQRPSVDLAMKIADVLGFEWSEFYIKEDDNEFINKEVNNVS